MIRPVRFAALAFLILGVLATGAALDWSDPSRTRFVDRAGPAPLPPAVAKQPAPEASPKQKQEPGVRARPDATRDSPTVRALAAGHPGVEFYGDERGHELGRSPSSTSTVVPKKQAPKKAPSNNRPPTSEAHGRRRRRAADDADDSAEPNDPADRHDAADRDDRRRPCARFASGTGGRATMTTTATR